MLESRYLKDNIENIQKLLAIPALKNFETKSLGKLLRLSKIREYDEGERIIKEGDFDPWLYFLLSGKIRITKEGLEIGSIDEKGEIFGEMRVIDSLSRSASVYAVGKTMCLAVDTSAKRRLSAGSTQDEKLDFLLLLYRIFAEFMSIRLRATNEELIVAKKKVRLSEKPSPFQRIPPIFFFTFSPDATSDADTAILIPNSKEKKKYPLLPSRPGWMNLPP
jgi:CRP-like cAMP-binding protein